MRPLSAKPLAWLISARSESRPPLGFHCTPGSVRFVAIYIQEAHAKDEWPISEAPREFRQHRGMGERLAAARAFIEDYDMPPQVSWYCDTMDDNGIVKVAQARRSFNVARGTIGVSMLRARL